MKNFNFYNKKGELIYSTDSVNSLQEADGLIPDIAEGQGINEDSITIEEVKDLSGKFIPYFRKNKGLGK